MAGHTREAVRPDKPTCERRWINISDRSVKRLQIFTRQRCSSQANGKPSTPPSGYFPVIRHEGSPARRRFLYADAADNYVTSAAAHRILQRLVLEHQLRALKDAGVSEVLICVHERVVPTTFDDYVKRCEVELGLKIGCAKEETALGTAGPLKAAEAMITSESDPDTPFIVVNSDVLCTYPLRDLLHLHKKHAREGTVLTTRCADPSSTSRYGVCVIDERTGRVRHFVDKPQTYVSDVINAGVYVFSPSIFRRLPAGRKISMNEILPVLANADQLHSMLLHGYWVKITDCTSFLDAVGPHLELTRFMSPSKLTKAPANESYEIRGDVMVHESAKIGAGCVLGPRVVIGPECVLGEGVRLEASTLLAGVQIRSHALVKNSLLGLRCTVGQWSHVIGSVFGEEVRVSEALLVRGATVLPHKELEQSVRTAQIII